MSINEKDPYFSLPQVSNSDLSWLEKYWLPQDVIYDIEKAYRYGSLLDAMITEAHRVNYFKKMCDNEKFTVDEFQNAEQMKKAFWNDEFCAMLANNSEMQKVSINENFIIEYDGVKFSMAVRCKWDLYAKKKLGMTGDIKSTTAKTQKQFIEACEHFQYFRQRAWYMDIDDVQKDMLIGISKINHKVFKVPIIRGGDFYKIGKAQYQELSWKWFYLFDEIDKLEVVEMNEGVHDFSIAI